MSGRWAVVEIHLCITLHLFLRMLNLSRLDLDLCKAICWRKYCQTYNRPRRWQVKTGKKWPNFKRPEDPLNLVQIKNPFGSFQCDPQAYAWWVPPFFSMKILNLETPYWTCITSTFMPFVLLPSSDTAVLGHIWVLMSTQDKKAPKWVIIMACIWPIVVFDGDFLPPPIFVQKWK